MRECGHNVQVPISERSKLTIFGSNHHYLECIKAAHEFASIELVNLIKDKVILILFYDDCFFDVVPRQYTSLTISI
jgi:gamma-tubulin complex component 2